MATSCHNKTPQETQATGNTQSTFTKSAEACYGPDYPDGATFRNLRDPWTHLTPPLLNLALTAPSHAVRRIQRMHALVPVPWLNTFFRELVQGHPTVWSSFVAVPSNNIRVLDSIRHLRLTIRHNAWDWRTGRELTINPYMKGGAETMRSCMAHPNHHFSASGWGSAFLHMPSIVSLIIDFETTEKQRAELETIVQWASTKWKFAVSTRRPTTDTTTTTTVPEPERKRPGWLTPEGHPNQIVEGLPSSPSGILIMFGVFQAFKREAAHSEARLDGQVDGEAGGSADGG
ncbi:hypothetical protein B0T16DRAFT_494477 [Cercophora newfieldiana]|uniref:Uncharacterized protein n=1 Tax=Cercophora newfieldiana TaxID=92897 RepID=A0AA39Y056_9PEZI|nr:hypothetical protein B0T16DRAFT_494477 [Cercophora newfieldiana]